jgi:glutathione S-transferase
MAKVEIYGVPRSNYTRVVRMVCEEKGIDYELKQAPPHSPEVTAIHPCGKIPVMRHGDLALFESKAIATYLDRSFPGPKLIPDDPRLAALVEQWVSLVNTAMDGPLVRTYILAYIFPKGPDGKPDEKAIDAVVPTLRAQLQLLDKAVAKTGHLVGDGVTLADFYVTPILYYLRMFPESAAALKETPHLAAYYDRLASRPSFERTNPPYQGLKR